MSTEAAQAAEQVAAVFRNIHQERMQGLPFLNPALSVRALGFREVEQGLLGVLVTPWFMNLILLPRDEDRRDEMRTGTQIEHTFPAGRFVFTVGHEDGLGSYQSCSLFSPMFEFEDQAAAEATALAAIEALFMALTDAPRTGAAPAGQEPPAPPATLEERLQRPMSRRALLRGLLPGGGADA